MYSLGVAVFSDFQDDDPLSMLSNGTLPHFSVGQDQQDGHRVLTKVSGVPVDNTDIRMKSYAKHDMTNLTDESQALYTFQTTRFHTFSILFPGQNFSFQ